MSESIESIMNAISQPPRLGGMQWGDRIIDGKIVRKEDLPKQENKENNDEVA